MGRSSKTGTGERRRCAACMDVGPRTRKNGRGEEADTHGELRDLAHFGWTDRMPGVAKGRYGALAGDVE